MSDASQVDVAIVGAGAAGLAAARELSNRGTSFVLLEASHRIGGRGYTEEILPGQPFDLGCHWMHSASLNPFVKIADEFGFTYTKGSYPKGGHWDGSWISEDDISEIDTYFEQQFNSMAKIIASGKDCSVFEASDREHKWTSLFDYIASLNSSSDVDQVSIADVLAYNDTDENWPVKQGFGELICRYGADIPVSLNSAVKSIDWSGKGVKLETAKCTIHAKHALITVSTGILAANDIRFTPELPPWKQEAISALSLGNHNRICLAFSEDAFGSDASEGFTTNAIDGEPMSFQIKPFGLNQVEAVTGGRFADWLERAGQQASIDYVEKKLQAVFGSDITKRVVARIVTAWRGDPWVKGAYSSAQPGKAHQRKELAKSIDDKLFFAGEATSSDAYATAHGAYLSGISAAQAMTQVYKEVQ